MSIKGNPQSISEEWILMHKNLPVFSFNVLKDFKVVLAITNIYNAEHTPPFMKNITTAELKRWLEDRTIPTNRQFLNNLLLASKLYSKRMFLFSSLALSLHDHYWIKPLSSKVSWANVNLYENDINEVIGNFLIEEFHNLYTTNSAEYLEMLHTLDTIFIHDEDSLETIEVTNSPEATSQGILPKKWELLNKQTYLIKFAPPTDPTEPYNEEIACAIARALGLPYSQYYVGITKNSFPYCICQNLTSKNVELIHLHCLLRKYSLDIQPDYHQTISLLESLKVPDAKEFINKMIVLDFLTMNINRHTKNIAILRNSSTLEILSMCPIYDTGTSLNIDYLNNPSLHLEMSKPFKYTHEQQLALIDNFDFIDLYYLKEVEFQIEDILLKYNAPQSLIEDKIELYIKRISLLEHLIPLS